MTSAFTRAADLLDGGTDTRPATTRRDDFTRTFPTALDVEQRLDNTATRTPALEHIAARLRATVDTRAGRLVVSIPPQEGKTELLRALCFWLLVRDPATRIVYASYALARARKSGRAVRDHIRLHGRDLDLHLDRGSWDAADWTLDGHRGGMLCVGVGGALTGAPADVLIVDDPIRGQQDADSETVRDALHEWWSGTARTRLSAGATVIVVQTRWHEDDLAGRRIAEGWPAVNIPALADGHAPDALDRPVGEWLLSAQGRTEQDWCDTRAEVGERAFAALYQGEPAPVEGGIFQRAWFDRHRLPTQPDGCLPPTVYVDPADNPGDGDEAGVLVATTHPPTRRVLLLADLSAPMTVARWARLALLTCVRWQAPTLVWEKSLSQLAQRITEAWALLHLHATAIRAADGDRAAALVRLTLPDDTPAAVQHAAQLLAELADDDVTGILAFGDVGPARRPVTARGSKDLRMQLAAPLFETGRAAIVGTLAAFEHQAATWQPGQDSPDRVDTAVHAVLDLAGLAAPTSARRAGRGTTRIPTRTPARHLPGTGGRLGR